MLNRMIVVTVTQFSGTTTPDKNGKFPVMLQLIAGVMPNRNVLSGTVAERTGIEEGKTYLMLVRETGTDDVFGKDYTFTKVRELLTGEDIAKTSKEIGDAELFVVTRPEGFESAYERKGNAVESVRTLREKKGLYHRSIPSTTVNHETAQEVIPGTSITGANNQQIGLTLEDIEAARKAGINVDPTLGQTKLS